MAFRHYMRASVARGLEHTIAAQRAHPHTAADVEILGRGTVRTAHLRCVDCRGAIAAFSLRWDGAGWDATQVYHFEEGSE